MSNAILEPEQKQTIDLEITPLLNRAANLVVKSDGDRALLVQDIKSAEELKERIEGKFHPTANKVASYEVYQAALDTEHQFYDPINAFIAAAKRVVKGWDTSETLRIQREQREAIEKREQAEREEKAKREAEALAAQEAEERRQLEEFERLEKEKKAKLDLQKAATESGNAKVAGIAAKEVAKIDNQIETVRQEGEQKIAEIQSKAEEPPVEKMKFTPPPAQIKKLVWKARVTNMIKLCRQIGEGNVPFSVVDVQQSKLNDFAKAYDGQTKIEGLEFYQESTGRI